MIKNHFKILFFLCLVSAFVGHAQEKLTVDAVLFKAQQVFANTPKYALNVNYKMFGNYKTDRTLEAFSGEMVNSEEATYLKIKNTVFLTNKNSKLSIKVFNDEKVMEVAMQPGSNLDNTSPVNIENFTKLFKNKKVEDKGDYYLCTLTADYITQVPYGKVEIYVQKEDFLITKQVLYFLSRVPYKDHNGEQQEDNPRLEVTISGFKNNISKTQEIATNMAQYITKSQKKYKPTAAYKDFKIIQN